MIFDMLSFFIILFIDFFAFGSSFYLLFGNSFNLFDSFFNSLRHIISFGLGNYEYFYGNNITIEIISTILIILFLFITNIILFNLLIAILSNVYSKIIERSNIEYSLILRESCQ